MLPAKPPFPTPWYLPFHPVAGIHTSILMSESAAGLISAVTRQKAGTSLNTAGMGAGLSSSNFPAPTHSAAGIAAAGILGRLKRSAAAAIPGSGTARTHDHS